MNKLKSGIVGVAAVASLALIGAYFQARMREKDEALVAQTDRSAQLEAENERLSNLVVQAQSTAPQPSEPSRELLRLRGEVGVLGQQTYELARLAHAVAESETNRVLADDQVMVRQNEAVDAITAVLQALKMYTTDHHGQYPVNLEQLVAAGDLKAPTFAGNLGLSDLVLRTGPHDPQGNQTFFLQLRVPIAKSGGGGVSVQGYIDDAGVPQTSIMNMVP